MTLVRNVSDDFVAVRQTNLGHLAHRRVRLLGRARHDLNADAASKRRIFQGWRLGLILHFGPAFAYELVDCRHFILKMERGIYQTSLWLQQVFECSVFMFYASNGFSAAPGSSVSSTSGSSGISTSALIVARR